MHELEVQSIVKRFGDNLVVDNISFHVSNGEFFVLLGPSGGGKTTTLRIVSGLEQPDEGRILINQRDVTRASPRQRNLGMVFQDYGIYPNMDVYGNIAYGLEARNVARSEIDKRVAQATEMLGLSKYLRKSAIDLSGGEQQRIALARAIVKDADVYLYDEPLSNLDPKLRHQARRDIMRMHRMKQKPSVYVTHDQTEAFAMGDRIAVIAKGHLQQVGTPDEILQSPANVFMARFVGTPAMNIIPGKLAAGSGQYRVRAASLDVMLPRAWNRALEQHNQSGVMLGVPPKAFIPSWQIERHDGEVQSIHNVHVEDVEPLIGETVVTLQLPDTTTVRAVFEDMDDDVIPDPGDTIKVGIDPAVLRLFNPADEVALKPDNF